MARYLPWFWLSWLALAPLPLGGNLPAAVALLSFGGVALTLATTWVGKQRYARLPVVLWGPATCAFLLAVALLWLPGNLPEWASTLSSLKIEPVWRQVLDPMGHVYGLIRWLLYGITFWLAFRWGQSYRWGNRLVQTIALAGAVYALYGLFMLTEADPRLFFWHKFAYLTSVTGPFVNRNNYATYAGMALLCSMVWLYRRFRELQRHEARQRYPSFYLFLLEQLTVTNLLPVFALLANLSGLLMSQSRAGLISFLVATLVLAGMLLTKQKKAAGNRKWGLIAAGFLLPLLGWLTLNGSQGTVERLKDFDTSWSSRLELYQFGLGQLAKNPWLGHGLESFTLLYSQYRPFEMQSWWKFTVNNIHNTYLTLGLDVGLPAALLILLSIALAWAVCVRQILKGKRNGLTLIAVTATLGVALHAFFDFSLEIPAVTMTWLSLLGAALGASYREHQQRPLILSRMTATALSLLLATGGVWLWQSTAYRLAHRAELRQLRNAPEELNIAQLSTLLTKQGQAATWRPPVDVVKDGVLLRAELAKRVGTRPEVLYQQAALALRHQLTQTPADAFLWAQLAYVLYKQTPQAPELPTVLELSLRIAPAEPQLVSYRVLLGQALWPLLSPAQQGLVRIQYHLLESGVPKAADKISGPATK